MAIVAVRQGYNLMSIDHGGHRQSSAAGFDGIIDFLRCRGVIGAIALSLALFAPSRGFAQTIDIGAANGFDVLAAYNPTTTDAGYFYSLPTSTVYSNVGLGQYGGLDGSFNLRGNLFQDSNSTNTATGSIPTAISADLSAASQAAVSAAATASAWSTSGNTNFLSISQNGSNYRVDGTAGSPKDQNVINVGTGTTIGGATGQYTLTVNGTASQQFVFNLGTRVSITDVNMVLTGGVTRNNIFFVNTGSSFSIGNSTISGTILNMNGKSIFLTGDVVHGAVLSDGSVSLASTVIAPEMPTIMMAGLAGLFVFGHAGFNFRRLARDKNGHRVSRQA
jgi:hypothetical protein